MKEGKALKQWTLLVYKPGSFRELASIVAKRVTKCQNATPDPEGSQKDRVSAQ